MHIYLSMLETSVTKTLFKSSLSQKEMLISAFSKWRGLKMEAENTSVTLAAIYETTSYHNLEHCIYNMFERN
jgi:hypothetical protein